MKSKLLFLILVVLAAVKVHAVNSSKIVDISAPLYVAPGATFSATIVFTNDSDTAWTAANNYALGAENPQDNSTWGTNRVPLPAAPINPGETAVFTRTFTAPVTPGIYLFSWSMVQDGVEWFGPIATRSISVGLSNSFTAGDLVVEQLGDGFHPLATTGSPIFINNLSLTTFSNTFQVALPTGGSNACIQGNNQFTGMIDLSSNKQYIVISGYNTNLPYLVSVEQANSPVPRVVATLDAAGNYVLQVKTTTAFAGGTFRGSVSDGLGNFWAGAQNSGIQYLGKTQPPVQISSLGTGTGVGAIRDLININGNLAFSTSQFPSPGNHGIAFFSGMPLTPQEPVLTIVTTSIPGTAGTPSAKGFAVNSNYTIAYVADVRPLASGGGIYRFNGTGANTSGSWTYAYTLTNDVDTTATGVFQELAVDWSGANPVIYATAASANSVGNTILKATDVGPATTWTLIQTAAPLCAFRGITFAPKAAPVVTPVSLSINHAGPNVVLTWPGSGQLQAAGVVTGPYTNVAGGASSPYTNSATSQAFYRLLMQ